MSFSYESSKSNKLLILFTALILMIICGGVYNYYRLNSPGRVLNIYSWDSNFRNELAAYYPAYDPKTETIGDVKVNWITNQNIDNLYQKNLDFALIGFDHQNLNERIDMFLVEADYIRKYAENDEFTMSLDELGIHDDMLNDQFAYTKNLARDNSGRLRAISWQATPAVMIYRRDIAEKVLGSDDHEVVQEASRDWEAFEKTAALMKAHGYHMLPGFFDTYRVFWASASAPWINNAGYIKLDKTMAQWLSITKRFADEGYCCPNSLWDKDWNNQVQGDSFCYFGPSWLIYSSLEKLSHSENGTGSDTYGKWAVCRGPVPFYWGGSWVCAYKNTDNAELVADIIKTMCLNKEVLRRRVSEQAEFVNDREIMAAKAADVSQGVEFLGGQNPFGIMMKVAESINTRQISAYDQGIHEAFQNNTREYFMGIRDWDETWQRFLATVWHSYPELQGVFFSHKFWLK